MYLTISKRFEFSASHYLKVNSWSDTRNVSFFGREAGGKYGHGHNYTVYFIFNGPVNDANGMMINVTIIKEKIKALIDSHYDHKFLNTSTLPFTRLVSTPENIARQLLKDVIPLFKDEQAKPIICHLEESPTSAATAYVNGKVEKHIWIDFSAARRTYSPYLSENENNVLFGLAASPSGHGHHYRLRVTISGDVDAEYGMIFPEMEALKIIDKLREKFDHRNLNTDIVEMKDRPITTETLTLFFWEYLSKELPLNRLRLYENDRFFIDCINDCAISMGILSQFHAAHQLHSQLLTDEENIATYGKCNSPEGHGHLYLLESSFSGKLNERSGTLYNLDELKREINYVLDDWNYKHLDRETDDFNNKPSTGENILLALWSKLKNNVRGELYRLRLWETPNNRFTLRRNITDNSE